MIEKSPVFQHFHPEEKVFVEQMLDKIERIVSHYSIEVTAFLNPREAFIVTSLAKRAGLQVFSSGEHYKTESVRLILAPDYYVLDLADFELALLELTYARKFNQLSHSQILGNLVNQLGIKRGLLGDILLTVDRTQVIVDQKMADFLMQHVTKISRVPVTWKLSSLEHLIVPEETSQTFQILSSSMRLDKIIAVAYQLTRPIAVNLVEHGKVKVNYQPITAPAHQLTVGDLVSCRGYGRFRLEDQTGQTKHGKYKLTLTKIGGK
ncbi:YlmH/Sll1252 family protein [Streptococcus ovuberis]|uniref:RNA-binding protein n=1 Tax=Streptococcus ovuberis TaxID=1936207 RepID=A0A7X6S0Q9_9STRE|nr:RNA-binding protein [Streptococcus ovuberis]